MLESTNLQKKQFKLILSFIIGLLIFQAILPYIKADDLEDGPLEVSTTQGSFNVFIGSNITITWSFNVPSHEYAVYWEIIGHGVNKSGWGINANCTTPVITTNGSVWTYNCSGYYAKFHVWSTVSVIGQEIVTGRENDGIDGIYSQKVNSNGVTRWTTDGAAINRASGVHKSPQIVSDGAGGAIITWEESNIYAQKINSNGEIQWALNGEEICTANGAQISPQIVSDGAGGAIMTWQDKRTGTYYDIYAQKINSSGDIQWSTNGTAICTASDDQESPQLVSDGAGGAIITWADNRGGNDDIYVQKINSSGDIEWTANGTAICTANGGQEFPQLVNNSAGEVIITWQDKRNETYYDIYAQKVNSSGDIKWTANGTEICTANGDQKSPQLVSNGTGGTIVTWQDNRGGYYDIYAQKVNSNGDIQWAANGTAICTANRGQITPQIVSNGTGGAIITWSDYRTTNWDIYAQRVNSSGDTQWIANGSAICTATDGQTTPQIISDGAGGAIITWSDNRRDDWDIYTQKVNLNGVVQWTANGIGICIANGSQIDPQLISNGAGGAIITWDDNRVEDVNGNGPPPPPPPNGNGNGNGQYIPGIPPYLIIIVFSLSVVVQIIISHIKFKKLKLKK